MIKALLVALLSLSIMITPMRQAQAFVPAAVLVGYVVTTGGTAYRIGQAAGAIGAIATLLLSSDIQTGTKGRVGLQQDYIPQPRKTASSQSGTQYRTNTPVTTEYPGGCTQYYQYRNAQGNIVSSSASNCSYNCIALGNSVKNIVNNPNYPEASGQVGQCGTTNGIQTIHLYGGNQNTSVTYSTDRSNGYAYVPAERTVADGFADVKTQANPQTGRIEFSPIVDDPDVQTEVDGGSTHPTIDPDTGEVVHYGVTPDGQRRSLRTKINDDGTTTITETTNNPDGTSVTVGRTTVNTQTGQITSANTGVQPGRVTIPTTTTVPAFPEVKPQTPPANPGTGNIVFPTDYARQYEAGTAAQTVVAAINAQTDFLTESADQPADPETTHFDFFDDIFDDLLSWQLPAHTGTCPTIEFEWQGIHVMDAHCNIIEDHRADIDIAFVLLWSLLAIAIVLRA